MGRYWSAKMSQLMHKPPYFGAGTRRRHRRGGANRGSRFRFMVAVTSLLATAFSSMPSAAQANQMVTALACPTIESASRANALPLDFFVRLIWRESHFQPDAVGPETRSGGRALGIAQFMPGTAMEHQLFDPFDMMQALAKSSQFLAELRDEFGNLGLAAAAYNAGPQRVRDFLAGSRDLPEETRDYVREITGRPVEEWTKSTSKLINVHGEREQREDTLSTNCSDLLASLENSSRSSDARGTLPIVRQNVPSWCRGLRHPNVNVCGPVHASGSALVTARMDKLQKRRIDWFMKRSDVDPQKASASRD